MKFEGGNTSYTQPQTNEMNTNTKNADSTQVTVSDATLNARQLDRLQAVLREDFEVHGRGNFPTLKVPLVAVIMDIGRGLAEAGLVVHATKLNGGAASHIMALRDFAYTDLDLIFDVGLRDGAAFDAAKDAVLDSLVRFFPTGTSVRKIGRTAIRDAYIRKMVKVDEESDRWSLFSLNHIHGRCIELKFVDKMRRQFEFSVDSFQIILDPLLGHNALPNPVTHICRQNYSVSGDDYEEASSSGCSCTAADDLSELTVEDDKSLVSSGRGSTELRPPPVVKALSMFGDLRLAVRHLNDRLIDTVRPEEIRGGGLLKYCHLLVRGYRAACPWKCRQMERYMCSRFFIDFGDVAVQETKLTRYLDNHFARDQHTKYEYLLLLYRVVSESTVCLMSHERRQTLDMIDRLAYHLSLNIYYTQQGCDTYIPRQTLLYLPRNSDQWVPLS